jgi:hypothetical protein
MSLASSQQPIVDNAAPIDAAELRALLEQLGRRIDDAKQELKSDIQSKLPSSRRFSWVLLFIAVQVVQGLIVVRYTVRAAATALDSAHIPEMTSRYSEALHTSQDLVRGLNQNVSVLSELVSVSTAAWKDHVQGFVHELPRLQDAYQKSARTFAAEASTLPARIVDRFFQAEEVKRSLTAYSAGVEAAAGTVQQRSDAGIAAALKAYDAQVSGPQALAHFEKQVEKQFDEHKERIADSVAAGMKEAVGGSKLQEKLAGFWDAGLSPIEEEKPEGWLYRHLRVESEKASVNEALVKSIDTALAPPLQEFFKEQLAPQGPLQAYLLRDLDKLPAMPQLLLELVKKRVESAIELPGGDKLPPLDEVLRDVVKARINVTLAALAPPKGPIVLTCK